MDTVRYEAWHRLGKYWEATPPSAELVRFKLALRRRSFAEDQVDSRAATSWRFELSARDVLASHPVARRPKRRRRVR